MTRAAIADMATALGGYSTEIQHQIARGDYTGVSPEDVEIFVEAQSVTPVEVHGGVMVKRDDLYVAPGGAIGGKARTCYAIAREATRGLVTAGSRSSPQVQIVAAIGGALGLPVRAHTPGGAPGPEVAAAVALGAERVAHTPGYNTVLISRARKDAAARGWTEVPFGMDTPVAVSQTAMQVVGLPECERIVVPVGSGMSLAGILTGLEAINRRVPIVGVRVGADPRKRLDMHYPLWRMWEALGMLELVSSGRVEDYHRGAEHTRLGDLELDPYYEAKCLPVLRPGDLLWVVGIRATGGDE